MADNKEKKVSETEKQKKDKLKKDKEFQDKKKILRGYKTKPFSKYNTK